MVQKYYCHLIDAAMNYKYRNYGGLTVAIEEKDLINNPVFDYKESDTIPISRKSTLNGKQLRELFVTVIFSCYLDGLAQFDNFNIKGNQIYLAFPESDNGTDVVIVVTKDVVAFENDNKLAYGIGGKSALTLPIQVKEYFNFADLKESILKPKPFDLNKLTPSKLLSYEEIILVYIRSFTLINFKELFEAVKSAGLQDKRIILIGMEKEGAAFATHYSLWDIKEESEHKTHIPLCNFLRTFDEMTKRK